MNSSKRVREELKELFARQLLVSRCQLPQKGFEELSEAQWRALTALFEEIYRMNCLSDD
jgi:hypothetical protein